MRFDADVLGGGGVVDTLEHDRGVAGQLSPRKARFVQDGPVRRRGRCVCSQSVVERGDRGQFLEFDDDRVERLAGGRVVDGRDRRERLALKQHVAVGEHRLVGAQRTEARNRRADVVGADHRCDARDGADAIELDAADASARDVGCAARDRRASRARHAQRRSAARLSAWPWRRAAAATARPNAQA